MTGFDSFLHSSLHHRSLPDASVKVTSEGVTLFLRFDSRDRIVSASYQGPGDIWMESLCALLQEMTLTEAREVTLLHWRNLWGGDELYEARELEVTDQIFFPPVELLHAALDVYQGREHLYHEESPLICRCFGVREKDVVTFLNSADDSSLEALSRVTKAGMGCRSCVPQLKLWLKIPPEERSRFYKQRPVAHWIIEIDSALKSFPEATGWKMQVESMKGNIVVISYDFSTDQRSEEAVSQRLQGFLGGVVDSELAFFLSRSRQR